MEHSTIWRRFCHFAKESLTNKFKVFFPGAIVGLLGGKSLLFNGLSSEMVTFGAYCIKYIGTVVMAFSSGLATAYAAYLVDKHKENQKKSPNPNQKRKAA